PRMLDSRDLTPVAPELPQLDAEGQDSDSVPVDVSREERTPGPETEQPDEPAAAAAPTPPPRLFDIPSPAAAPPAPPAPSQDNPPTAPAMPVARSFAPAGNGSRAGASWATSLEGNLKSDDATPGPMTEPAQEDAAEAAEAADTRTPPPLLTPPPL